MPETLAGVRFWGHRGRKRWQGCGFLFTEAGHAGNAGRGMVWGPPGPEMLPGVWFCIEIDEPCCQDIFLFGGGARFQTRFQGGFIGGFIPDPPGERETMFDIILLCFLSFEPGGLPGV